MGKLAGKIAIITGGTSGIGFATAQRFVAEGAYVFITGSRQVALDAAVQLIGSHVAGVQGDVANLADLDRLYATLQQQKGRITSSSRTPVPGLWRRWDRSAKRSTTGSSTRT
jgi:NAD(P)-dependent dehydrogenase (short-subunit alcohol dehydrogenase family)